MTHASIDRITSIARALGPLASGVVFIGGAIAPLLHTEPTLPSARQTKDVDAVIGSHSYADTENFERQLRELGFQHAIDPAGHAHRWLSPQGIAFDLVPAGPHLGGSGNMWDALALATAESKTVNAVTFRHASAAAFFAMKLEAFKDRGGGDMRASHDIEDVIALIASRSSIVADVSAAPSAIAERVRTFASVLLSEGIADEILAAHLNNAEDVELAIDLARERLTQLASSV